MENETNADLAETKELEAALRLAIVEGFVEVPMLPEVASQALSLAQDPEVSASQMAALLEQDQSLAGHVMRIANSVAYTPMANLVSLQQAIARLGMVVISEIALTAAIGAKLFNTPGYEAYVEYNWQHAMATALWAKTIASEAKLNAEAAFLAGLLHSIGRPAVLQTVLELARQENKTVVPEQVHHLENQFSQAVTELVVSRWQMPVQVQESVKPYDTLDTTTETGRIAAAVHAGERFATYMLDVAPGDDEDILVSMSAFDVLGISEAQAARLLGQEDEIQQRLAGLCS
jgi:HD-like signal output (HDOD) protein